MTSQWFCVTINTEHFSYSVRLGLHSTDESAFLMSDVAHIPQTAASHQHTPTKQHNAAADMLREDPRDTLHQGEMTHLSLSLSLLLCFFITQHINHICISSLNLDASIVQVISSCQNAQNNLAHNLCVVFVCSAFDKQQVPTRCPA